MSDAPADCLRTRDVYILAATAGRDPRTVRAVYAGRARAITREAVADAARALGFPPPPASEPTT